MLKRSWLQPLLIGATYIGTVIGVGFASGQEIFQFFNVLGNRGLYAILFITFLFFLGGWFLVSISNIVKFDSYHGLIEYAFGKKIGLLVDIVLTLFFFGEIGIVLAASGAIFREQLSLPFWLGVLIVGLFTILIVHWGILGITRANLFLIPLLIIIGVSVGFVAFSQHGFGWGIKEFKVTVSLNWMKNSFLYVCFNLLLAMAVLTSLGKEYNNIVKQCVGCLIGSIGIGLVAMTFYLTLNLYLPNISSYEIPMLYVADQQGELMKKIYTVMLCIALFTRSITNTFSFVIRIESLTGWSPGFIASIGTIAALPISALGFANLIKFIYPMMGYIGLMIMVALFIKTLCGRMIFAYFK